MATLNRIFFRGLITIIPIAVTLYLLFWIVQVMENIIGRMVRFFLPESFYIPGLGVVATFALIFMFGLLLNNFVLYEIMQGLEKKLKSIPFFKAIYAPLRDLMNLFSQSSDGPAMKSVVLIKMGEGIQILGVITREDFSDMPESLQNKNLVTVYCPWSYGMGGFTVLVPKNQLQPIDMPIERAMSLAITGWVKAEPKHFKEELENKL